MSDDFIPRNELEEKLLAAMEGRLDGEQFVHELLESQVYMPVRDRHGIGGLQDSQHAVPLEVPSESGENAIAVFTSPERAKPVVQGMAEYGGGLLVEFKWILAKLGGGYGIVLNPGWEDGIEMEPGMVQQLAEWGEHRQ